MKTILFSIILLSVPVRAQYLPAEVKGDPGVTENLNWLYQEILRLRNTSASPGSYLGPTTSFSGDVSGFYNTIEVGNDSHLHTAATISGVTGGDNLGSHIATTTLQMGGFQILSSSDITAANFYGGILSSNLSGGIPSGLVDLSTVTTALSGKLSNTSIIPTGLIDLSTVTTQFNTVIPSSATGDYRITVSSATELKSDPAACTSGQYVSDISASGLLTCGTPSGAGDVLLNSTQTFTGRNTFTANSYFPASGIWKTDGSVGIGTQSPSRTLDVNGTSNFSDAMYIPGGGGIFSDSGITVLAGGSDENLELVVRNNSSIKMIANDLSTQLFNFSSAGVLTTPTLVSSSITFIGTQHNNRWFYGSSEAIDINAGKSGGIVHLNPGHAGHVGIAEGGGRLGVGTSTGYGKLEVISDTTTAYSLLLGTATTAYHVAVTTIGNVGIGTTSPTNRFTVMGDADAVNVRIKGSYGSFKTAPGEAGDWVFGAGGAVGASTDFSFYDGLANASPMIIRQGTGAVDFTVQSATVTFSGLVDIGFSYDDATDCGSAVICAAHCPAGKRAIGGGCYAPQSSIYHSSSNADPYLVGGAEGWFCAATSAGTNFYAVAYCARIK